MPDDIRSQRLEWIRDGSNWLVGFAAGALVLSGTYFHDKFTRDALAVWPLVIAWVLLTASILAGVFTYFSAWKDLLDTPKANGAAEVPLGNWVRCSYTVMMWTFLFGYLVLAAALIMNSLRSRSPSEDVVVSVPLGSPQHASIRTSSGQVTLDVQPHNVTVTLGKK